MTENLGRPRNLIEALDPAWSPKARDIFIEHRRNVSQGWATTTPINVRINSVQIARAFNSAWVIACHVRAAINGETGASVQKPGFSLDRYVEKSDLGSRKEKKRMCRFRGGD